MQTMNQPLNKISIIGAGAWGTALAQVFAEAGRTISLYVRMPELQASLHTLRRNPVYLPDLTLHHSIHSTTDLATAVSEAEIVLIAAPTQFVRETLIRLKPHLPKHVPLVSCAKGIEVSSGKLLSEVAAEITPHHPYAVLSGPTFAHEVARGLPTAVTFATTASVAQAQLWAQALSSKTFRPYLSADPVGAEVAGAVKNVIAIACGIVEGRGLGQNAKAALMTRGMAEIKRLGMKMGAEADTFLGLSGIGDLTLTCHSMSSRNYSLGVELGRNRLLQDILAERSGVTEGITTAAAVADCARRLNVEMPVCTAVDQILHRSAAVGDVVRDLLSRDLKTENK